MVPGAEQMSVNEAGTQATEFNEDKSTLIFVKGHTLGTDKSGRTKLDLRLSEEETKQIIEELGKIKARAKIQIHIGETSAFLFVKEVMSLEDVRKAQSSRKPGYGPKVGGPDVKAKIANMKK